MRAGVSFLAGFASLAVAGALDQFIDRQQWIRAQGLIPGHGLWQTLAVEVGLVLTLLFTCWLIAFRLEPPRWTSVILLVVSSLGAILLPLHMSGIDILGPLLEGRSNILRPLLFQYRPGSMFALQCIGLATAAATALFAPRHYPRPQP